MMIINTKNYNDNKLSRSRYRLKAISELEKIKREHEKEMGPIEEEIYKPKPRKLEDDGLRDFGADGRRW